MPQTARLQLSSRWKGSGGWGQLQPIQEQEPAVIHRHPRRDGASQDGPAAPGSAHALDHHQEASGRWRGDAQKNAPPWNACHEGGMVVGVGCHWLWPPAPPGPAARTQAGVAFQRLDPPGPLIMTEIRKDRKERRVTGPSQTRAGPCLHTHRGFASMQRQPAPAATFAHSAPSRTTPLLAAGGRIGGGPAAPSEEGRPPPRLDRFLKECHSMIGYRSGGRPALIALSRAGQQQPVQRGERSS